MKMRAILMSLKVTVIQKQLVMTQQWYVSCVSSKYQNHKLYNTTRLAQKCKLPHLHNKSKSEKTVTTMRMEAHATTITIIGNIHLLEKRRMKKPRVWKIAHHNNIMVVQRRTINLKLKSKKVVWHLVVIITVLTDLMTVKRVTLGSLHKH